MGRVKEAVQDALDEHGECIDASYYATRKEWSKTLLDAKLKSAHHVDERQLLVDEMTRYCLIKTGLTHPNVFSWDDVITFYLDSERSYD